MSRTAPLQFPGCRTWVREQAPVRLLLAISQFHPQFPVCSVPELIKRIHKLSFLGDHMDALDFTAGGEPGEEFTADLREHRVGNEGIDHASAAFQFAATLADEFGHAGVEGKGRSEEH